jgi:integrase
VALLIAPLDLENWLKEPGRKNGLENQTRSKIRQVIGLVYKHAQRVGFLPRTEQANPIRFVRQSTASNFDPIILTPAQAFAIINQLELMLRTLVLVTAATALRISEILALQWRDIDVENQCIHVRRAYVYGRFGKPKSKASKRPVPLHPLLAAHLLNWRRETLYSQEENLVFPSRASWFSANPRFVGILWASSNRGIPNKCFEMWWPGTELNRRRQPFQGCALPPELPGHISKPAVRGLRGLFASR